MNKKITIKVGQAADQTLITALDKLALLHLPDVSSNWRIAQLLTFIGEQSKTFHIARSALLNKFGTPTLIVPADKKKDLETFIESQPQTRAGRDAIREKQVALGGKPNGNFDIDPDNFLPWTEAFNTLFNEELKTPLRERLVVPLVALQNASEEKQLSGLELSVLMRFIIVPELVEAEDEPVVADPVVELTKPVNEIVFKNDNGEQVGKLDFTGDRVVFTGDVDASVEKFIAALNLKLNGATNVTPMTTTAPVES